MTDRQNQDRYDVMQARAEFESIHQNRVPLGKFDKYRVSRVDGRDRPGGDKDNAVYFVLDIANDSFARDALATYAYNCKYSEPQLSKDLYDLLEEYDD